MPRGAPRRARGPGPAAMTVALETGWAKMCSCWSATWHIWRRNIVSKEHRSVVLTLSMALAGCGGLCNRVLM